MKKILYLSILFLQALFLTAQNETDSFDSEGIMNLIRQDSMLRNFHYQTGKVLIGGQLATVTVPEGCLYLGPEESKIMMEEIFGNPPSPLSLGMLLSDTPSVFGNVAWIVDINYTNEGHIKDDDAEDINYDDLLKQMKEEAIEASKERVKQGYESVSLIGWAQPPFYDIKNKKLHWAKELVFGETEEHTLNYNIRLLGREGFIEMNIITGMSQFPEVKKDINKIIGSTEFNNGQRYADFNEDTDKTAEYGIGGLILGGVLAKTGILAKIGIFLLKIIKPLIIGVIALFGFIGNKFFKRRKENQASENEANDSDNA